MLKKSGENKIIIIIFLFLSASNSDSQVIGGWWEHKSTNSSALFESKIKIISKNNFNLNSPLKFKVNGNLDSAYLSNTSYLYKDSSYKKMIYYHSENLSNGLNNFKLVDSSYRNSFNAPGFDSIFVIASEVNHQSFFQRTNKSPEIKSKPIIKINKGKEFRHIPCFFNKNNENYEFDLLNYGDSTQYWIPDSINLNSNTGEFIWNTPDTVGNFDFTIEILTEDLYKHRIFYNFRVVLVDSNLTNGNFIERFGFNSNSLEFSKRTINPGANLNLVFSYSDSIADSVQIEGIGGPFLQTPSPFFFTSYEDSTTINASFSWTPDSSHVRPHPYILTFIGKSYPSCTWHYKTVMIYVEDPTTSVKEESRKDGGTITIRPNPVRDELLLSSSIDLSQYQAHIMDMQGQRVKEIQLRKGKDRINVQGLEKGIYFLVIQGQKGRWQERFVKE